MNISRLQLEKSDPLLSSLNETNEQQSIYTYIDLFNNNVYEVTKKLLPVKNFKGGRSKSRNAIRWMEVVCTTLNMKVPEMVYLNHDSTSQS